MADFKQGIQDARQEHDDLERTVQGSKSVLVGGETVTEGAISDGDDPDKGATDLMGEYGGYAALAGGFLLTLPAGIVAAGLETFINYKFGEIQGALVNLIPDEETRNKVNLALALLPIFHAARGGGGERGGGERGGGEHGPAGESGRGPADGGATERGPSGAAGETPPAGQPTRAGRTENASPENAPPAENPVHQIGEKPGGSDGSASPDQAGGSGSGDRTADTPGAAQPADPLVPQGDSPGGLRAADGSGERPDLSPEENFPGQQSGNNCAPQSAQQIIRQATGKNYSEAEMEQMGQDSHAYDPKTGTRAGGEADILKQGGVEAHTQAQTPENIQKALDNGQGVITGHDAATLWEGDPNYTADPNNPVNGGHAVHTTGLVRDADGNVTHYVINDTGTGTSGRMVPADQYHGSLDTGPAVVTDAPTRNTRKETLMPTRYTTAEVVEAVGQHPERWAKVTRESSLSLPIPTGHAGAEALAFFWYPAGGPANKQVVRAPTFRVTASLNRLDEITFLPIPPEDTRLGAAPTTPLGDLRVGGPVPPGTMQTLKSELFTTLDSVLDLALAAVPPPDTEKDAVAALNALYHRLAVLVLLPAYRALNPEFFAWMEQNAM